MASRRPFVDCGAPFEQGSLKPSAAFIAPSNDDVDGYASDSTLNLDDYGLQDTPPVPSFVSGPFEFGAPGEQAEPQDDFDVEGYSLEELIATLQTLGPFTFPGADRLGQLLQDMKIGDKGADELLKQFENFISTAELHSQSWFGMGSHQKRDIKRAQAIARRAMSVLEEIKDSPGR